MDPSEYVLPDTSWMTPEEGDAWALLAVAATRILQLPEVHPSDRPEAARDIHDLQNRLLTRASYSLEQRLPVLSLTKGLTAISERATV